MVINCIEWCMFLNTTTLKARVQPLTQKRVGTLNPEILPIRSPLWVSNPIEQHDIHSDMPFRAFRSSQDLDFSSADCFSACLVRAHLSPLQRRIPSLEFLGKE